MEKIRAVNLGGWFVLERWMTPLLFTHSQTDLRCETSFVEHHPNPKETLEAHWGSWIQKSDLEWIKKQGLNLVRIPIPWWLFPHLNQSGIPYHSPMAYLDQAMNWCHEVGLQVMLDLHTAPGSQNGFDNGGIDGVLSWHHKQENIDLTVEVLKQIALRYGAHPALHSIQALNEPHWTIDLSILQSFYLRVYDVLRPILPASIYLVFHDGFRLKEWTSFFQEHRLQNVILDTHLYQCFDHKFHDMDWKTFLAYPQVNAVELAKLEQVVPVVVGEWSLGARAIEAPMSRDEFERQYAKAQIRAYEQASGWIFWSYKIHEYQSGWNLRSLIERGVFTLET